ncbi:50S ribosomal protein L37ae [Candidatus Woesearchaeota archaeon]|nr:50S ribosomal protein L37ae [Candidatus Woesearchaeota archaeon]
MVRKHEKAVKRLGARYGRKIREKLADIEVRQKAAYKCPYCMKPKVKRLVVGIWQCNGCNAKFTGGAYSAFH